MKTFLEMQDAFDYCREVDKPVKVIVLGDGQYKLYPSGKAELIAKCDCGNLDNHTVCPAEARNSQSPVILTGEKISTENV